MSVEVNVTRQNFRSKGHTCSERRREVLNAWKDLRGKLITNVFRQWISTRNLGVSHEFLNISCLKPTSNPSPFYSVPSLKTTPFTSFRAFLKRMFSIVCRFRARCLVGATSDVNKTRSLTYQILSIKYAVAVWVITNDGAIYQVERPRIRIIKAVRELKHLSASYTERLTNERKKQSRRPAAWACIYYDYRNCDMFGVSFQWKLYLVDHGVFENFNYKPRRQQETPKKLISQFGIQ